MADLLAQLQSLQPSTIWTLAPKPLLMQGVGLMATGDVSAIHWSGTEELVLSFPNRLSSISHRLRLEGDAIIGQCDIHPNQPCAHHLAGLMLVVHLLNDSTAFGRFPNRHLADSLKNCLIRRDARATLAVNRPPNEAQKHVLIRPQGNALFTYRDKSHSRYDDPFAPVPNEVRGFCSQWGALLNIEDAFWKWFNDPLRRLPVFIELDKRVLPVEQGHTSGWRGEVVLSLDNEGIIMRRHLLQHNEPVPEQVFIVGKTFAYLADSHQLVRPPANQTWTTWQSIAEGLQNAGLDSFTSKVMLSVADQKDTVELPISFKEWNHMAVKWWQESLPESLQPRLEWEGKHIAAPAQHPSRGHIALTPSKDGKMVIVEVGASCGGAFLPTAQSVVHAESLLELGMNETQFMSSKGRREAILTALFESLLADDPKDKANILKTLASSSSFRFPTHGKEAARLLRKFIDSFESTESHVIASPEHGWLLVSDAGRPGVVAGALARQILGAKPLDDLSYDELELIEDNESDIQLALNISDTLTRLPALMTEGHARGIDITFASKPINLTKLDCSVSAVKKGEIDFFELKPEVTCNGTLIPQEQWENLVVKGHMVDDEGNLQVIDLDSLGKLQRVSTILKRQRGEQDPDRKGKQHTEFLNIPRVRILDWLMLQKHGIECKLPAEERAVLDSLIAFEKLEREPMPAIKATLRDYQIAGYSWLAFLYKHGFGACLADDMGLGKTLQTITLLAGIKEGIVKPLAADATERRPHLLIVPPTLLFNWTSEVKHFCPGLYVHEYTGKNRSLIGIKEGVILTTYELARRDIDTLKEHKFDCIIFDEAQAIKNLLGERSRAMRQLQGRFKLTLTGTPLENHAGEYYSIIELGLPGIFGDYGEFMKAIKRTDNTGFNPLDRARPFVLRRTKEKILKELPPKVESDLHLDLTEEQKRFYTRAVADVRAEVLAAFKDKTAQQAGIVALSALTRLRQICVSPALIDPTHTEVSPKIAHLIEKTQELAAEGHAALIFSQFTKSLDLLELHLKANKIPFQRLDGSTPQQKRKALVEDYQTGKGPPLFLISLKAGGAGLNLTRASYVFHLDPWWNPAVENQASDRAHRMGQKQTVFIQRLLMRHTIEEKIMQLKAVKQELFDRVIAGNEDAQIAKGSLITRDDFSFLLD